MIRKIASWGMVLAILIGSGQSFGQDKAAQDPAKAAEALLTSKELRASAAMYIATAEDDVKKAHEAAEARLKEYRQAYARERGALQEIHDKKAYAAELTKERDELKQQMEQALPAINAQIQALNQQRNALNMQSNSMQGGGSRAARSAGSMIRNQSNQLSAQVNMLQAQSQQFTMTYNNLNAQIKELNSQTSAKPDPASKADPAAKPETPKPDSSEDKKESYVKAIGVLRKQVDVAKQKYTVLAEDAEITSALGTLSQRSARIKYVLGPSKKFHDTVKALEQAEAKIASDTIIDWPRPADSAKKKSKTARKK